MAINISGSFLKKQVNDMEVLASYWNNILDGYCKGWLKTTVLVLGFCSIRRYKLVGFREGSILNHADVPREKPFLGKEKKFNGYTTKRRDGVRRSDSINCRA